MNEVEALVAKVIAWRRGRAVPVRETSALAPDPDDAIGIATLRVVTEDQLQALAFGSLEGQPAVIARLLPLARETADLEPFAEWLVERVRGAVDAGRSLRLWLPHGKTVETLEILGRRYERNQNASPMLREAARYCRILAEETRYAGQQTVAVALDAILVHSVTGQTPIEDQHLGAVLAWMDPGPGRDARELAAERARWPASGVLINAPDRDDDNRIERLRKELKGASGTRRARRESEIRRILADGVGREWELLVQARRAFWSLGLARGRVDKLSSASDERVSKAVKTYLVSPRQAVPIARKLDQHEHAMEQAEEAALRSDALVRRRAARLGRVVAGVVERVDQPRRNCHPCHVLLNTPQKNLRVRRDERVSLVGSSAKGVVRDVRPGRRGTTVIRIELKSGVRGAGAMTGTAQEWIEDSFPPYLREQALWEAASRETWMVTGAPPPQASPSPVAPGDPLVHAHAARRRS